MSQFDDSGVRTLEASAPIAKHARVALASDGTISTAGLTGKDIGTALNRAFAAGDRVAVKLTSAPGTHKVIAAGAVTRGARLYTAASGAVDDAATATAFQWGTALEAATTAGDILEALVNAHGDTAAS